MLTEIPQIAVQIGQLIINVAVLGGIGIWRLAQAERDILTQLTETFGRHQKEVQVDMTELRKELNDTERWVLEQFVRREDLKATIDQMNLSLSDIRMRFDTRLDRIENKLDALTKQ